MDPKLVAAAFGMDPQSPLTYLADHVDDMRLSSEQDNAHPGTMP